MRRLALLFLLCSPAAAQTYFTAATRPACTSNLPREIFIRDATTQTDCTTAGGGTAEAHCCCQDAVWAACGTPAAAVGGGDSITVNSSAAVNPDFLNGDIDWTLGGGGSPITATVGCMNCVDLTTETVGNYAAGDAEAGAATTGDSATSFFSTGTIDTARLGSGSATSSTYLRGDQTWAAPVAARVESWANPPSSAHSSDDEFNDGDTTGWTIASSGTANAATTGSINYSSSLTTPIVDATSITGWVAMQSDNTASGAGLIYLRKAITASTNNTYIVRVSMSPRAVSNAEEGTIGLFIDDSGDANEQVSIQVRPTGAATTCEIYVNNNGSITSVATAALTENIPFSGSVYLVIWKVSNVYHGGCASGDGGAFQYIGSVTKTGVTTLNRVNLFNRTANETPSLISAFDFFRMEDANDWGLVNP